MNSIAQSSAWISVAVVGALLVVGALACGRTTPELTTSCVVLPPDQQNYWGITNEPLPSDMYEADGLFYRCSVEVERRSTPEPTLAPLPLDVPKLCSDAHSGIVKIVYVSLSWDWKDQGGVDPEGQVVLIRAQWDSLESMQRAYAWVLALRASEHWYHAANEEGLYFFTEIPPAWVHSLYEMEGLQQMEKRAGKSSLNLPDC